MKNIFKAIPKTLLAIFIVLFASLILVFSVRGLLGNPDAKELNTTTWKENGPFELSPERGRFSLLYSIIEDKSFYFSTDLARFTVPDLGYKNGHYVSLFAPGVSFIAIPGYLIGKAFGASQVGTFSIVGVFAIFNFVLVKLISKKLGANEFASWLASIIFLFATPAYTYAVTLYQHHISTFLILLAAYIVIKSKKIWPLFFVWLLCAASIPIDYPNLVLMLPIGVYALLRVFEIKSEETKLKINLKLVGLLTFLGILLPTLFFTWFNTKSYGDPLQFSGTVGGVQAIDASGNPTAPETLDPTDTSVYKDPDDQVNSALNFFKSRRLLNGFYLQFVSPDRGIGMFTPIVLSGLVGIYLLHKRKNEYLAMLTGVVIANIILYALWADPWGGWAFGSRYLIPGYAIMAIFISIALTRFNRNIIFLILFLPLMLYSIGVNAVGSITTDAIPPQVEALPLEKISGKQERYSYDRGWELLKAGKSKSFVYQTYVKESLTALQYYWILAGTIGAVATALLVGNIFTKNVKKS